MHVTRIKICGITRPEDALMAARAGVDAIGCILWPNSPRGIDLAGAAAVLEVLPPFVDAVAVVVDPSDELLRGIVALRRFGYIQFHGQESPERCAGSPLPYLKAVRVRGSDDVGRAASDYSGASALLLDTFKKGMLGGTGQVFDWSLVPAAMEMPIVLSGGLAPGNVAAAITTARPYAVDASSGVEISPGVKDPVKINALIREVRRVPVT